MATVEGTVTAMDGDQEAQLDALAPSSTTGPPALSLEIPSKQDSESHPEESPLELLERENDELRRKLESLSEQFDQLNHQHKDALDKHSRDRTNAQEDLQKKNGIIDKMRVKLNRYEFAIKEAILFLSKPMEGYEAWLSSRFDATGANGSQAMLAAAVAGAIAAAQGTPGPGSNAPPSPAPSRVLHQDQGRSRSPSTAPKPASGWGLAPSLSKDNRSSSQILLNGGSSQGHITPQPDAKPPGATNLEIQCLECMRLALNYLKNAQSSVQAMGKDGSEVKELQPPPRLIAEGSRVVSEILLEVDEEEKPDAKQANLTIALQDLEKKTLLANEKKATSPRSAGETLTSPRSPLAVTSSAQTSQTSLFPPKENPPVARSKSPQRSPLSMSSTTASSLTKEALILAAEALPEEEDGDITASKSSYGGGAGSSAFKKCPNCRELRLQNDHHVDTINQLRENVTQLANEIEEQRATIERIQLSKDILDQELEELTAQLFDQANRMVIDEARMREELENSNRDLRGELKELLVKFEGREDELRELRKNLRALEAAKNRSANASSPYGSYNNLATTGSSRDSTQGLNAAGPMIPRGSSSHSFYANISLAPPKSSQVPVTVPVDGQVLSEFQDHIKQLVLASSLPPSQGIQVMLNTTFMKRCLVEDVEPCLFYTYSAYMYTSSIFNSSASNMPATVKRKLMDSFVKGAVDIFGLATQATPDHPNFPELQPPKTKCFVCSLIRECDFRLRLSSTPPSPGGTVAAATSEIYPLCRFCRDRVATVSDFFTFMGHLRQGLIGPGKQGATMVGMFRHALWLRRRMAAGRVGSCSLFEAESLHSIDRRGDGEWEKAVHIIP
ncbi:rab guanine nucleotide exchange factor S2 [Phlyctochytrium bullatum]|nr:rab guanine nucleotide exchange factor S2 [Phlyctochytrium bullatum]